MSLADLQRLQAQQQNANPHQAAFPWAHLWFLYYLLLFYAGALIVRAIARAADASGRVARRLDGAVRFCLGGVWGAAAIGLPLAAYFYNLDGWPSWTGLPAPLISCRTSTVRDRVRDARLLSAGSRIDRRTGCSTLEKRWLVVSRPRCGVDHR